MEPKRTIGKFTVLGLAGEGSFGKVWKAVRGEDSRLFAIKEVTKESMTEAVFQNLLREVQISRQLDHPNLSHCVLTMESKGSFYMVFEFCEGGDLEHFVKAHKRLPPARALAIARQLRAGYQFLFDHGVMHRDLKLENILFVDKGHSRIRISDFGSSKNSVLGSTIIGTPKYMAPEVLAESIKYNYKADLWSFALCVWELLYGQSAFPFSLASRKELEEDIRKHSGEHLRFPPKETIPPDARDFFVRCLTPSPEARINATDFFNHPFFDLEPDEPAPGNAAPTPLAKTPKALRYLQERIAEAAACEAAARELLRWIPEPKDELLAPAVCAGALLLLDRARRRVDNVMASLEEGKNVYEVEGFEEIAARPGDVARHVAAVKELRNGVNELSEKGRIALEACPPSKLRDSAVEVIVKHGSSEKRKALLSAIAEGAREGAPACLPQPERLAAFQVALKRALALMGGKAAAKAS